MSALGALVLLAQVVPAAAPPTGPGLEGEPRPEATAVASSPQASPPPPPRSRWFVAKGQASGFYSRIFAIHATGIEGAVGLGSSTRDLEWDIGASYGRGNTGHGLGVTRADFGINIDWIFDRLRLGLRPSFGLLAIERATRTEGLDSSPNTQVAIRLDGHVSFDVLRFAETDGLYVLAALQGEVYAFGPFVALGYRFEAAH